MSQLEKIKAKYLSLLVESNIDLESIDPRNRPSWEAKKRNAKNTLKDVSFEMASVILNNSIGLYFVEDLDPSSLISLLTNEGELVVAIDAQALEKELVAKVFQNRRPESGYAFNSESTTKMNNLLHEVSKKIGAMSMPFVKLNANKSGVVHSEAEAVDRVGEILEDTYDKELKTLYVRNEMVAKTLNLLSNDKLIFVISNLKARHYTSLAAMTGKSTSISGQDYPGMVQTNNEYDGAELLKQIVSQISSKRNNK